MHLFCVNLLSICDSLGSPFFRSSFPHSTVPLTLNSYLLLPPFLPLFSSLSILSYDSTSLPNPSLITLTLSSCLQGDLSPGMRGLAPSRQFHSVYQDKHEKRARSSSSGGREEVKMCEGIKERTDDEEDDEEHTTSYDSSDGESSQLQLQLLLLLCHCFYHLMLCCICDTCVHVFFSLDQVTQ